MTKRIEAGQATTHGAEYRGRTSSVACTAVADDAPGRPFATDAVRVPSGVAARGAAAGGAFFTGWFRAGRPLPDVRLPLRAARRASMLGAMTINTIADVRAILVVLVVGMIVT